MTKYVLGKAFVNGAFVLNHVVDIPHGDPVPQGATLLVENKPEEAPPVAPVEPVVVTLPPVTDKAKPAT